MDFSLDTITNWLTAGRNNIPERGTEYLEVYRQSVEADFKAYDPGFTLGKWLGSGGFCDVFLVPQVNVPGKGPLTVVLRILRPSLYRTPDSMANNRVVKTFLTEIFYNTYLTSQNVRNVVKIFDYGNLHNKHYFTMMDYVDGPNFSDLIKRGPRDVKELMRRIIFINAVAGVVGELHFRGIIHMDLKPSNIIVKGWEPFLSDLGAARWMHVKDDVADQQTTVLGTPSHMSYEQLDGDYYKVDHRSDIFSLGAMAAYAFTGIYPFARREDINFRVEGISSLSSVEPEVPEIPFKKGEKLREILMRCMHRDIDQRPKSVVEFQHSLNTWILEL
jgi:eukaryotic-like serine/threonine-protein kinase